MFHFKTMTLNLRAEKVQEYTDSHLESENSIKQVYLNIFHGWIMIQGNITANKPVTQNKIPFIITTHIKRQKT